QRITAAFLVFDEENIKAVDSREVAVIVRSLGCCPSESEMTSILLELEDQETPGSVHLERFLPIMTRIIAENRFLPVEPGKMLQAFKTLDAEGKGYLRKEEISGIMASQGEAFSSQEMEEMLSAALSHDDETIDYEHYVKILAVDRDDILYDS
ncbi:unnamed protein product, partial [Darwinula stevensoni]